MKTVSVIMVTFHEDIAVLQVCFERLFTTVGVELQIYVIDNAGRQATQELVVRLLPQAVYIGNERNTGFAHAVNQGLARATGDYILLLNPDTEITDASIHAMVTRMDASPEVGIGSCRILYPDGRLQESIRRFPSLTSQIAILLKLPHVFARLPGVDRYMMRDVDPLITQDVDSIMGAFMMIRRDLIVQIGMFDERYFIWFEEVDYCRMAVDAGWKVRHFGDIAIVHHKGHMFKKQGTLMKQRWIRTSMRKYFYKHEGFLAAGVLWILAPLFVLCAYVAAAIEYLQTQKHR